FAARYQVATTVYNPLAGGILAGRHEPSSVPEGSRFRGNKLYHGRYWTDRRFTQADALAEIAASEEMTPVDLAYAWLAGRPGVTSVLIGPGTLEHLESPLAGLGKQLSPRALTRIDDLARSFAGTDAVYA